MKKTVIILLQIIFISLITSCTFDYGESGAAERETPDLVMQNVEYVRIRSSDPIARFQAERAERYDKQGVMKLHNFSFEQYGERGEEINAIGKAGYASVEIESGDVYMDNGVSIEVESEDIIMETKQLEWKDEPRTLASGAANEVNIYQKNGTHFVGIGLLVDTRNRMLEFSGHVHGTFISDDEEDGETDPRPRPASTATASATASVEPGAPGRTPSTPKTPGTISTPSTPGTPSTPSSAPGIEQKPATKGQPEGEPIEDDEEEEKIAK